MLVLHSLHLSMMIINGLIQNGLAVYNQLPNHFICGVLFSLETCHTLLFVPSSMFMGPSYVLKGPGAGG